MDKIKYFVSLDENGVVENYFTVNYSHSIMECSPNHSGEVLSVQNNDITCNGPQIGYTYDSTLNAFIPPKPDETFILNTKTFDWDPDPNVIYYHMDNIPHKWDPETRSWYLYEEPPAE